MNVTDKEFVSIFTKTLEGTKVLKQGVSMDEDQEQEFTRYVFILNKKAPGVRAHFLSLHPHKGYILPHLQHLTWPKLKGWSEYRTVVYKQVLYFIGGKERETGRYSAKMMKYSPCGDKWTVCANMKKARVYFTVNVLDRRIIVTGGESVGGEIIDSIESYEPLIDMWTTEGKLPQPKKHHSSVVVKDKLYICGGQGLSSAFTSSIWELNREFKLVGERESFQHTWSDDWDKVSGRKIQQNTLFSSEGTLYSVGGLVQGPTEDGKRLTDELDIEQLDSEDEEENELKRKSEPFVPSYRRMLEEYNNPKKGKHRGPTSVTRTTRRMLSIDVSNTYLRAKNPYKALNIEKRMLQPRAGAALLRVGQRIYVFGGYKVEDESPYVPMVEYYHMKRKRWYSAFNLTTHDNEIFRDIEVQILDIPSNNPNFRVLSPAYKYPMW